MMFARLGGGKTAIVVEIDWLRRLDIAASLDGLRAREPAAAQAIADVLLSDPWGSWRPVIVS